MSGMGWEPRILQYGEPKKCVLIKILLQLNFVQRKCKLFSIGSPSPTTGSFSETCQLLRSIFLFLLRSLSPSFSYHNSSNGPVSFSAHTCQCLQRRQECAVKSGPKPLRYISRLCLYPTCTFVLVRMCAGISQGRKDLP